MRRLPLAVIGCGRIGRACAEAVLQADDLRLAGIVRRPETQAQSLPATLRGARVVADLSELEAVEAALLCLPPALVPEAAHGLIQHRRPFVECSRMPAAAASALHERAARQARHEHVAVVLGAGWDPGLRQLLAGFLTLMAPKGRTEVRDRPGVSLHHTLAARNVPGVRDALCAELRTAEGKRQRYVYVELAAGADLSAVEAALLADPLFLDEATIVAPVESIAALEEEGHGAVLERRGTAGLAAHQHFLIEARFDLAAVTAQAMLAAARSLPHLQPGAYTLADLPPGLLHGPAAPP